jgi:rhamnulokinase
MKYALAIDIGASSGRHIVGWEEGGEIKTEEIYRFPNGMDNVDGHLVWDTDRLFLEVKRGLKLSLEKYPTLSSLSIDTWGVDYVLMNGDEEIKPTYAYRDSRVDEPIKEVHNLIPFADLYSKVGTQFNSFNTIYQLYADKKAGRLEGVTDFLMIPEYLMYKLTGVKKKEFTDATTTGLINCESLKFDKEIWQTLGFPEELRTELYSPGTPLGKLKSEVAAEVGGNLDVILCATHDTASAVEAIDMETNSPYISSGTWSLLGVKTERALTDEGSRLADYSNEGGVGYNRYQKNITGMWIIQSLRRELCPETSYAEIAVMASESSYAECFDVNDASFMAPESMKDAILDYLTKAGKPEPKTDADYFNSAYHSLAAGYRDAISALEANTGKSYPEIYIVGGGAKNNYLNSLTEKYTGKRVRALPIEATAIGNLKIQLKK